LRQVPDTAVDGRVGGRTGLSHVPVGQEGFSGRWREEFDDGAKTSPVEANFLTNHRYERADLFRCQSVVVVLVV